MNDLEKYTNKGQTQLEDDYLLLKGQYIHYLTEKDILLECGKPQIDALYMVKIGQQQFDLMQRQLDFKQLKRKVELAVGQLNHNQRIDWKKIDNQLDTEFVAENERIFLETKRIEQANYYFTHLHTVEDTMEIRRLYRQLAKMLHPDVNPNISQMQISLWYAVKEAYDQGNLDSLRSLEIITGDFSNNDIILSKDYLLSKIELMKTGIKNLINEIQHLLQQFPFSIEKLLNNEMWVQEQCREIALQIELLNAEQTKYTEKFELLKYI